MNNYIFDLDGTLINSSKEVLLCMEKAFLQSNYPLDKNRLNHNVIGPPLKEIIKLLAPELEDELKISEIVNNFRELYDNDKNDISEVYGGVYKILTKLKQNGKRLFMATFKPTKPTMRIIEQFGFDCFEEIYTIDKFEKHITKEEMIIDILKKYNLEKSETCMIGDAVSDMKAAKSAGVVAVAATWGYGDNKKPLIENADIVINSIEELCQK